MTSNEFISTGMESLDKLLEGGILRGFTTLILGPPGSSMEILGKQLATTDSVLYISTDETKDEVAETMGRFGWDSSKIDFVDMASKYSQDIITGERRRVSIYERRSKQKLKELIEEGSSGIPVQAKDKEDFLAIVSNEIRSTSSEKIIINSLDFFLNRYSQDEVLKTLHASKVDNVEKKGALFIIMTKGIYSNVFEKKMERIADCVIELEVLQKGSTFERFLAITKVRNYAKKIGMARYVIDSDGFVLETIERII